MLARMMALMVLLALQGCAIIQPVEAIARNDL
ncbi:MAG: hypothetical protein RIS72_530 [Pseudomonadota bacterium]